MKTKHKETRESVLAELQQRWPLNSEWHHSNLGTVRVVRHLLGDNTEGSEIRVSGGLQIVDQTGKQWSCYCPQVDLHAIA